VTTANAAAATANGIDAKAQLALDNSVEAVNSATMAYSTAISIDAKATQAQTDAAAALAAATSAESKANLEIADLPEATEAHYSQEFVINDDGERRKITLETIQDYLEEEFEDEFASKGHNHGNYASKNHKHFFDELLDVTLVGEALATAQTQAAARAAIGAGTSNLTLGYSAGQAKPGDWQPNLTSVAGTIPITKLTPYSVGDNFTVSLIPNFGVSGNQTNWWSGHVPIRATSYGTVRIRLTHMRDCIVRINGTDVAYWGGNNPNFVNRVLDIYVSYGDVIQVGLYGNKVKVKDISIRTAAVAPLMITAYGLGGFGTPVNPTGNPNPPGSGGGH